MHVNSNISSTGQVEKYIGTAYDKMAALYDQLDALVLLAEALDNGDLDDLLLLVPEIERVLAAIDGFNDIYYGPLVEEPSVKPSGAPSTQGDIYFNTTIDSMYVYTHVGWERQGVVEQTVVSTWDYEVTGAGDEYVIELPNYMAYVIETNNIQIWNDNQVKYTVIDFIEEDALHVRFNSQLTIGDKLFFRVGQVVSNSPRIEEPIFQETMPSLSIYHQGQIWFDTSKARVFMLYNDGDDGAGLGESKQWVSIAGEEDVIIDNTPIVPNIPQPEQIRQTFIQVDQPDPTAYSEGAQWLKSDTMELFFLFDDEDPVGELHWVKVST